MASKDQFEAFKLLFQIEEERAKSLTESGKTYLTLVSLFFAYLGYKTTDADFESFLGYAIYGWPAGLILYGAMVAAFLAALLGILYSLFIRNYQRIMRPEAFFNEVTLRGESDADILLRFIANMNAATENNAHVNNCRGSALRIGAHVLFLGFLLYGGVFCTIAWCKPSGCT